MSKQKAPNLFIKGKKIILCPIHEGYVTSRYLSWLNDKEVTRYMEAGKSTVTLADLNSYVKKINESKNDVMFAILDKGTNLHIGNVKLGNINWGHRFADLGIMIGEKGYWGKGFGKETCELLLGYAFTRLNLHKIILGVYAVHSSAIAMYKKTGFVIEGRISSILNFEGRYVDKILMGITKEEFFRTDFGRQMQKMKQEECIISASLEAWNEV